MIARAIAFAVIVAASSSTSLAQSREPIGRWVADVRVTSSGLPGEAGWTPVLPTGTEAPGRGLGLEAGAHVYVLRWRAFALGVGASWLTARGSSTPPQVDDGTTTAPTTIPDVTTRVTTFAPQVSLNFGHSLGWSYLSFGLGRTNVESEATLTGATFTPRRSEGVKTLNYGGGARWFLNDHLGVGFDLRWHNLSLVSASATHPGAPRASLIAAGAGIVLK
jgi:hypothetical protein